MNWAVLGYAYLIGAIVMTKWAYKDQRGDFGICLLIGSVWPLVAAMLGLVLFMNAEEKERNRGRA